MTSISDKTFYEETYVSGINRINEILELSHDSTKNNELINVFKTFDYNEITDNISLFMDVLRNIIAVLYNVDTIREYFSIFKDLNIPKEKYASYTKRIFCIAIDVYYEEVLDILCNEFQPNVKNIASIMLKAIYSNKVSIFRKIYSWGNFENQNDPNSKKIYLSVLREIIRSGVFDRDYWREEMFSEVLNGYKYPLPDIINSQFLDNRTNLNSIDMYSRSLIKRLQNRFFIEDFIYSLGWIMNSQHSEKFLTCLYNTVIRPRIEEGIMPSNIYIGSRHHCNFLVYHYPLKDIKLFYEILINKPNNVNYIFRSDKTLLEDHFSNLTPEEFYEYGIMFETKFIPEDNEFKILGKIFSEMSGSMSYMLDSQKLTTFQNSEFYKKNEKLQWAISMYVFQHSPDKEYYSRHFDENQKTDL